MSHKLLLADDSVTIQRVIELTFADEDIKVTVVGDGKQAIERILLDRPDIVLADIGMPERDGYEVAAFLRGDPRFATIPVILLTGAFEPLDEDRARSVGCDGVLVKPFEPQMVINRVRELLSGQRPVAAPAPSAAQVHERAMDDFESALAPPPAEAAAPKAGGDALEDYFDRLDAAFANIGAPAPGRVEPAHLPAQDLSGGIGELHQPPPASPAPGEDPFTAWDPDLAGDLGPPRQPHLANAFAALLAAEEGHPAPQFAAPAPSEEVVEDIVRRVIARMSDDAVRQTVLETAERLVRQEIERIKLEARASSPQSSR